MMICEFLLRWLGLWMALVYNHNKHDNFKALKSLQQGKYAKFYQKNILAVTLAAATTTTHSWLC